MKFTHLHLTILALAILVAACAPAPTNPVVVLSPIPNLPPLIIPTETILPPTEAVAPPPPPANDQALNEYTNGTLWIHLLSPQDEAVVQTSQIFVTGEAPAETAISLNDEIYLVTADQTFNIPVNLEEGPNVLEFIASDPSGNEITFFLTVTYEP